MFLKGFPPFICVIISLPNEFFYVQGDQKFSIVMTGVQIVCQLEVSLVQGCSQTGQYIDRSACPGLLTDRSGLLDRSTLSRDDHRQVRTFRQVNLVQG
jgi:hypothetical protein